MRTGVPMRVYMRAYMRTRGMSKYKIYSSTAHEERGLLKKGKGVISFLNSIEFYLSIRGKGLILGSYLTWISYLILITTLTYIS